MSKSYVVDDVFAVVSAVTFAVVSAVVSVVVSAVVYAGVSVAVCCSPVVRFVNFIYRHHATHQYIFMMSHTGFRMLEPTSISKHLRISVKLPADPIRYHEICDRWYQQDRDVFVVSVLSNDIENLHKLSA